MTWLLKSVIPVWILVAVSIVMIRVFSAPAKYLVWLSIVLASAVIVSFCIQLALRRKEGLMDRIMASTGGCVLLLAVATVFFWPLSQAG
ncbi:MAG: hypothetical protein ACYCZK_07450 [Microbacteriaceae bacterium]